MSAREQVSAGRLLGRYSHGFRDQVLVDGRMRRIVQASMFTFEGLVCLRYGRAASKEVKYPPATLLTAVLDSTRTDVQPGG